MKKQKVIHKLNEQIDNLILAGKTKSQEFKRLTKLHKIIIKAK